jgi:zinc protease
MATKAKISDSSVEEERAVILDEISEERAIDRYTTKRDTVLFEGTPYPHRKPAGLAKVVRECTPDQIRAFYQRTYLPQNMALVAVGDFDQKQVEGLIQKHFNDIPLSSAPPITHHFQAVGRKEPQFICHADPESTTSLLQLHYPLKTDFEAQEVTLESMLQGIINSFYHLMFNRRLQEIVSDSESSPFIFARGSKDELADNLCYYRLSLIATDGEIPNAYKRLLLELKRIQEHGFLQEEFESAKKTYKIQLEHLEKEKNHMSTKGLASTYVSHFSDGNPYVDTAKSLQLKKILLNCVKPEHVNLWNKVLTSNKGAVISTYLPASIEHTVSPDILRKIGEEATAETVTPYVNTIVDRPLLRQVPQAGKIVETAVFEKVGVTKWTLENGMNVYIRPSTQKDDSILIYATSIGGELSVPFEKRATADMAIDLYARSGLAGLTLTQLKKVLEGTTVGHKILIGNYMTSLLTTSSKKDLETAFQVLYTTYADRTFRKEAFNAIKKEILNAVKHQDNDPNVIFRITENNLCTQNHPQYQPLTATEYEKAEYQDAVDFLNSQFQNPTNFDLVITGNINPEETKQLVEKYLAALPSQGKKADFNSFKYPGYQYPDGIVVKEVEAGLTSQCQTHISFPAPAEDTKESRQLGAWTASLLDMHLTDRLRFVKAENYGIDCDYSLTKVRGQEKTDPSSMELEISGLPENIRDLNGIVLKEIERLQTEGFTTEELASFHAQVKETYRKQLDLDSVWMSLIAFNARWGWDINTMTEDFYRTLEGFNEKVAQEYLKKLFPLNRYVQVTLFPKKAAVNLEIKDKKN